MAFKDNREFIEALEKSGDVVRIKQEADWDLEVGGITRRACELSAPAPFFEKIKDYPPGYRIFGTPLGTFRRLATALGLKPTTSVREIYSHYESRMEHPIKPVAVKEAPCKEEVVLGDEVDLYRFPAPMVHWGDGGRYLGTWHLVVSQDPNSDWVNWGMYRLMVHNKRDLGSVWRATSDLGRVLYTKYMPQKKPMPVAVAIGADPLCSFMAQTPLSPGQNEGDYAGALRGEPVELVKCETNDLMVPAYAEIVLEGEILPDIRQMDGPFGEYTGYRTSMEMRPVLRIKAITHRHNPILTMTSIGIPPDDHICWQLATAFEDKKHLREHGIPVTDVFNPPQAVNQLTIVGIKAYTSNLPTMVKNVIHSGFTRTEPHIVVVVDSDVDVFNISEVMHAFATKCHPLHGVRPSDYDQGVPLWPFLSPYERRWFKGAKLLLDCTWPRDWSKETEVPPRVSFKEMYPKALQEKVLQEWESYGFKG